MSDVRGSQDQLDRAVTQSPILPQAVRKARKLPACSKKRREEFWRVTVDSLTKTMLTHFPVRMFISCRLVSGFSKLKVKKRLFPSQLLQWMGGGGPLPNHEGNKEPIGDSWYGDLGPQEEVTSPLTDYLECGGS